MSINIPLPEDPHVAVAVARAEHRRGKLERLSDIGMALAEQVGAHAAAAMAAVNEARAGDPGRTFATVSRAVRMTLALEARFDDHILALRRGEIPTFRRMRAGAAAETAIEPETAPTVAKPIDPRRARVDVAVREVIHLEAESLDEAREALDALHERLFDRETYDVLLNLPARDAVAAICADLGLEPDWSLWSDDAGFVVPPGRRRVDWTTIDAQSPRPGTSPRTERPPIHRRE